ncbi:sigma-70 family RNA polymerase sigma factor [Janibacter anophelis]|uniref:sigma-70 family RNA polymerase sigma factor n=1 Tax=Janibacter anophelis TaxID=319054 RepID=UPI000DEF35E2|nr:sigma-70 family RNA polymerase sigma factor [Janibacter anophelis]
MTTEAVLSSGASFAPFATPTHAEIAAGIAQIEAELSLVTSSPAATTDAEPWVLDHSDDAWHGNASVGPTAFARRAHRVALLSAEDEVVLARRIEAGAFARERLASGVELKRTQRRGLEHVAREADEARERMILANTRLVASITRSYLPRAGHGMDFEDLQQAGLIGLMRAVDKFDHTLGHKFSTYATWWIKQSIGRAVDDESRVVRLPVHVSEKCRPIDAARRRAGLTWAQAVADPGLLGDGVEASRVELAARVFRTCLSLDQVAEEVDVVDPQEATLDGVIERVGFGEWWKGVMDHLLVVPGLGERAVAVLEMRVGLGGGEPQTLDQIGQHFGVTRERIRQIEKKALDEVRDHAAHELLLGST